jgi:hypothetical protein
MKVIPLTLAGGRTVFCRFDGDFYLWRAADNSVTVVISAAGEIDVMETPAEVLHIIRESGGDMHARVAEALANVR